MSRYEYECALSGLVAQGGPQFDDDNLDDLPAGWSEVKLSRRVFNPKWVLIQQVKRAMVDGLMAQFPEAAQAGQEIAVRLQVDAQFYMMESDTPIYLTEIETVYLAPKELNEDVAEAYNQARKMLGLEPLIDDDDEGEDDEETPEGDSSAEPESAKKTGTAS